MSWKRARCSHTLIFLAAIAASILTLFLGADAQGNSAAVLQPVRNWHNHAQALADGREIYRSDCAACHGDDGKGTSTEVAGFQKPTTFPDFTRCDQTTSEYDTGYKDVILHGGPARGFSPIMPAFSEALTPEQADDVITYLRSFCQNPKWPKAELNLPLALGTEKAYPEDEEVLTSTVNINGEPGVEVHEIHEQRFGVRNQIEIDTPINFVHQNNTWYGGFGDVTFGLKRVMFSNIRSGSILSLQGEVVAPTGNYQHGLGSGTTTFGTFAMFDQLFPTNTFIQFQGGANLPVDTQKSPQDVFWNTAIGQSFAQGNGLGRLSSPMVEFLADRELMTGAKTNWNVLPEMQVTLSRRQHIRGDIGVSFPVNNTAGRQRQLMFYLLWDWQDGSLTRGW